VRDQVSPIHPGEVVRLALTGPPAITQDQFADALRVSLHNNNGICRKN
jgi:plasmid maintenance system antidote protein VapI